MTNPLLEVDYKGATGALIHISGGDDLLLDEVTKIGDLVTASLDMDANVIWGSRIEEGMTGKLRVMTIITGVKSPYILGKVTHKSMEQNANRMSRELGIDIVR